MASFTRNRSNPWKIFPIANSVTRPFFCSALLYSFFMLKDILERGRILADSALERLLPPETTRPVSIHKAMRHSVFAGGKRIRPILCMEAGTMIAGTRPPGVENLGAALEMLHTYSLI